MICLVVSTPLKHMKVSWDYDIPNIWKNKSHVPTHQAGMAYLQHSTSTTAWGTTGCQRWVAMEHEGRGEANKHGI
jgi:hypothetical protein